ncbi:MAG: regulatory iron-sulfur-containing complex subunit RicT, partial [Candidatus Subteraquimicrobiales bacterium]|nr:regulatory iron-sulfur-containing complex subunit RicT [Candidatus Subteraquimicrobiales bacterium]
AMQEDRVELEKNREIEREASKVCEKKIAERNLPMKLVEVECVFDKSKLIFYFTAEARVDFRDLVKDLASIFHTRIEMRQIGVRDEAKLIGGLGTCGRPLCCTLFLSDFEPVSIRMAKEQGLPLSPLKISGICGRLMCCLGYEFETYREFRKRAPKRGTKVGTPKGEGVIVDFNVPKEKVIVEIGEGLRYEFSLDEIEKLLESKELPE